ncbi:hypothetical protein KS4_23690 [Poriferisphaera corsica]|uniref:Uncharacterized protein n=1 Tax=Poriferisphaera corsica TaxID=2528020 RepID=A0A517YVT2_9BACT|nr:hypothetical protein KS4_23690 [Poriferisphaera corsica]
MAKTIGRDRKRGRVMEARAFSNLMTRKRRFKVKTNSGTEDAWEENRRKRRNKQERKRRNNR